MDRLPEMDNRVSDNTDNNGQSGGIMPSRRQVLRWMTGVSAVNAGLLTGVNPTTANQGDYLLAEDFEGVAAGGVPSDFVLAGDTDQLVVDDTAVMSSQSYEMNGSHGGCWRAIARVPFDVADEMTISGYFKRGNGETGCHSGSGAVRLNTEASSGWSEGSKVSLLRFFPDGTVKSAGTEVGEYSAYEWTEFEIGYVRDPGAGEVTQHCRIGGGEVVSVIRNESSSEDNFSALDLASDDFTVYWDEILIEEGVGSGPPETGDDLRAIEYGETKDGEIDEEDPTGYRGYYEPVTFSGNAGDVITAEVTSDDDPYLMLLDPSGDIVVENDDGGPGLDPLIDEYQLQETGEYTIIVTSYSDRATFPYTLSLEGSAGSDVSLALSITDATAQAGGTAIVTFTLTNEGNTTSTGLEGIIDLPSDWALGESGSFTSLGPGESESVSAEILVPESASGEYTIDGSVTDGAGNEASASATITVEETGEPEFEFIAEASPDTVAPGEETTLEFSITNVGDAVSEFDDLYAWLGEEQEFETAFPNMGPFEISSHNDDNGAWDFGWLYDSISPGETRTPSIDVAVAESASLGEYTFALENIRTDDDPAVATVTLTVAEESSPPDAAFTYTPEQPFIDDVIEFEASSSADPDGAVITYEWRLGADDEFAERGEQFSVAAGDLPEESVVTLRVTDREGETDTASQTVTIRGKQFQQAAETKLSNAAEIEQAAVYLSETQDVENILSELRTDLRSGSFSDESIPTETVRRHQFGELTTLRLLEKTGPVDTLGNEQIAVKTTAFTVNLGVSLVMMQLSFTDLLSKTSYGSYLPDPQRQLDAINNAVNDIVSFGFSAAQQTEAISEITDTAQEAYNQLLDGQFENADEFQQFLTDSISGTISTLTLQRAVETGAGFTPFAGQTPLTVVDQFANAEGSLDYLQANLDSESVQTNGLEGTLDGAIDAHDEAKAVIDQIASITDTFLSELENNLGFLSIIGNIYELLTGIHNIQGGALRIVGALAVLVPKSGLAVATVRAIGSLVGEVSLRLMMTANAYGVFGVKRGDPLDLEDIAALIPEPADILGDIEAVDERWGDVA